MLSDEKDVVGNVNNGAKCLYYLAYLLYLYSRRSNKRRLKKMEKIKIEFKKGGDGVYYLAIPEIIKKIVQEKFPDAEPRTINVRDNSAYYAVPNEIIAAILGISRDDFDANFTVEVPQEQVTYTNG